MQENFYKYITNHGNSINNELKYNMYSENNDMIQLLLFDYILDTFNNYDYRNCPDYKQAETPIIIEDFSVYRLIDFDNYNIVTQDGEVILLNFPRNYNQGLSLIDETETNQIISEGDYMKFNFDKQNIKKYLYKLVKNLKCYE